MLLNLSLAIAIFQTTGLYKAGIHRRNYAGIVKAISLSSVLLLFVEVLYGENTYIPYATFLVHWLLSISFICSFRYLFNFFTNSIRQKGAVRHRIFIIRELLCNSRLC